MSNDDIKEIVQAMEGIGLEVVSIDRDGQGYKIETYRPGPRRGPIFLRAGSDPKGVFRIGNWKPNDTPELSLWGQKALIGGEEYRLADSKATYASEGSTVILTFERP